jgi:hypothetical protein
MTGEDALKAIRACAVLGGALWAFAAIWALTIISSGLVNWQYASIYLFLLVIIVGLSTNVVLFRRATILGRTALIGLIGVSFSLSALVAASIVYMATG